MVSGACNRTETARCRSHDVGQPKNPTVWALGAAGGSWDNAKNPRHGATVIGDTVGDTVKDTAGPSLNTLISMVPVATIGITLAISQAAGPTAMPRPACGPTGS